ncbi:hypothetical protein [Aurantibacillus circumpalustris]|uniref:hypothetical protein n=1 Tax=Aurantibacillus circumpalustris TaxID=3036359 RepID=UPI00295B96C0|nr:hypothetical protein [Aurantibacillus circumpalustris]
MKDIYLVHITLPDVFSQAFYDLIQKQRNHINELLERQIIISYSLDMERKNVWVFISANSEKEVRNRLNSFPIIKEVKVIIHELAFHDAAHKALPDLILN